jgi:transcriptional regulator NrdR family protein
MRELKMDDVAYIRFASVYEDFQRVDDFHETRSRSSEARAALQM